ncbi:hypothetical protein CCMSSC00406_0007948 [Pleurotus cornucopiae]|uniref:Uncharacterized protein n=1 Tax=Pleurotus cornucopiae TaxID=5321 RepID=A0ACB7IPD8_PLECO|nr:hypothetical protein CCMSSC00406_0007948 [Pleurotus cornucopiae]
MKRQNEIQDLDPDEPATGYRNTLPLLPVTFAMVNKRDKAQKAAKKKVTVAAQKSDSIKIRLPAAVRHRASPRHEQDTQSTCMRTMVHQRDSGTSVPLAMDRL